MIDGNLLKDFVCSKYTLDFLAEKYNMSKADILSQTDKYSQKTKSNTLASFIKTKYKKYLLKDFIASFKKPEDFAAEYGLSTTKFLKLMAEIVEDRELVPSDGLADNVYSKAIHGLTVTYSRFPERIVYIIAKRYTQDRHATQESVGIVYDIDKSTVSNILRRGIAEDIIDDDTAELVFSRVVTAFRVCPKYVIRAYEEAFDKRHVTKLKKQLHQMEAMMESDDESIDYAKLGESIEKLRQQIERYTSNP